MACEDWPCCGHGTDANGQPDCPSRDAKGREVWRCTECGRKLSRTATSSICPKCMRRIGWSE